RLWGRILASVLRQPLVYRAGADVGPALGAARLARLAATGEAPATVCIAPPVREVVEPQAALADAYAAPLAHWRALYAALRPLFPAGGSR
ncbi:MAG: xylulokinase, partial [Myxococcota bacterium]|nr:xylulokinase [Myxococcota bacterium]